MNSVILFGIRKNCHSSGRNILLYLFMKRVIKVIVVIIKKCHCYQVHTKFHLIFVSQDKLHMWTKLLGIIDINFDIRDN